MMRKHLKPIPLLFATLLSVSIVSLLLNLTIAQPETDEVVTKVTLNHGIDIKKPIIDISGWQLPSEMNYDALAQQVNGVIVRVQHGISLEKTNAAADKDGQDKAMAKHIKAFQKRGVPVAVYAYIDGTSKAAMRQEAKKFYQRAVKYHPTFWWVDVEEVTMKKNFNQGIQAFREELVKLGAKKVGIYTQDWFVTANQIDVSAFDAVWLAHYGRDTGYWDASPDTDIDYDLHQYTSQGRLNGFAHDLDFNRITNLDAYNKLFNHGNPMN
ncbi:MAG: glycosyl hydrolase family 25 [Streptococcaceae bacterium]|jgi:lysozyme|nr:glycosyl hydrolase family 25 [Streptococcaceae bacterium]